VAYAIRPFCAMQAREMNVAESMGSAARDTTGP
jgi:hypothetical protein